MVLPSSGTSFAAPMVSGILAAVRVAYPQLSPSEAVTAVREGVDPVPFLGCDARDRCVATGGRAHLAGALQAAARMAERPRPVLLAHRLADEDGDGTFARSERVELDLLLRNAGYGTVRDLSASLLAPDWVEVSDPVDLGELDSDQELSVVAAFELSTGSACEASTELTLVLTDASGETWEAPIPLEVACDEQPGECSHAPAMG